MGRTARAWLHAGLLLPLALRAVPASAASGEARRLVDSANAALAAQPPRTAEARAALQAACAAGDDPEAVSEAYFRLGHLDEADGAYAQAMADDAASIAAGSNTRWAFRASDREDWLRARSEGDFGPLRRLETFRHDGALSSDPAALDALARDADGFPPGMVRVEARMLVAEAWIGRLHRQADGVRLLRMVTDEKRVEPLTLRLAEREMVEALVDQGRIDEAMAEVTTRAVRFDPKYVTQVRHLGRRRAVGRAAVGVLAIFGVMAAAALARGWRRLVEAGRAVRTVTPTAAVFVAFAAGGGGLLASEYETGNAAPFLMLGAGIMPLVVVTRAWSALGSQSTPARVARATLCAAAVMATSFVLLESLNPQYLEGFGL